MRKSGLLFRLSPIVLGIMVAWSFWGPPALSHAQTPALQQPGDAARPRLRSTTNAQRKAAAKRAAEARNQQKASTQTTALQNLLQAAPPTVYGPGPSTLAFPDYFSGTVPNYANSPIPQKDALGNLTGGIRKFVDSLPGLGPNAANDLGNFIPIAKAVTPPAGVPNDGDYYEIGLNDYYQKMHFDLPDTLLRGFKDLNPGADGKNHYMGPMILARKDRPVRIKFTNTLGPAGVSAVNGGGDLFLPVDKTVMGAGNGPDGTPYTENRGLLHLHGGHTPWISDGTPRQWTAPAGEVTNFKKGVSAADVSDMPASSDGDLTYYYSNQQSGRLLFYHDHSYGITRQDVYAGEAAVYLITDPTEDKLINSGVIPDNGYTQGGAMTDSRYGIPLVIQDKTFIDATKLQTQDPTWLTPDPITGLPHYPTTTGSLWFPHVYMPNQNPTDLAGVNAMGRWDYGPWFWPPFTGIMNPPIVGDGTNGCPQGLTCPGTPNPSIVPEAYMDTAVVNGQAYPYLTVAPKAYRFRILNIANDRFLNLQLYYAATPPPTGQTAGTVCRGNAALPDSCTEVNMVPAIPGTWPAGWPTPDARDGGWPDPATMGPQMIQIGTESGFLPTPYVVPNRPIGYDYNRRSITVLNVLEKALFLGPAERADVIIDFSSVPDGSTVILYNDAPAPTPAFDTRNDYYTGAPDQTTTGGAPTPLPGYGPNTRTIMQFRVSATAPGGSSFSLPNLQAAFASTGSTATNTFVPGAFAESQNPVLVPQASYNSAYNASFPQDTRAYARIQDTSMTFTPLGATQPMTLGMMPKAIQEDFDMDYGRMNAILGTELPNTNATIQTTVILYYIDPPTETILDSVTPGPPLEDCTGVTPPNACKPADGTQIWKITHNGVDTHSIHFHLFDVQLINRVGWDGMVKPPDPNEVGWKETVSMNPLEDVIVALRPTAPALPFGVPNSSRLLNPTMPVGDTSGFSGVDPLTGNPMTVTNQVTDFAWEYMWHCHILGHEENDMMRPMVFKVTTTLPAAPMLSFTQAGNDLQLTWTDATPAGILATLGNPANEIGFQIQKAVNDPVTGPGPFTVIASVPANTTSYVVTGGATDTTHAYRIVAYNASGTAASNSVPSFPKLLWSHTSGLADLWTMDWTDTFLSQKLYGPYAGWSATSYWKNSDGTGNLLWTHTTGEVCLWTLDSNDNFVNYSLYGPYAGWSATSYRKNSDGTGNLLWTHTTGQASLWTLDSNGAFMRYSLYGPFAGWSATSYRKNSDGTGNLLWSSINGEASIWTLDSSDAFVRYALYGPYAGWSATSYWKNLDGTGNLLWSSINGEGCLWTIDSNGAFVRYSLYGPYAEWQAESYHK